MSTFWLTRTTFRGGQSWWDGRSLTVRGRARAWLVARWLNRAGDGGTWTAQKVGF